MTIFAFELPLVDFMAARTLATESAIRRGGEMLAAKGLSEARGALRVTRMTLGSLAVKARLTSDALVGVPVTIWRLLLFVEREEGLRTRAVTLWPM